MKSFEAIKQLGVVKTLKPALDQEKYPASTLYHTDSDEEFSFSPEKSKRTPGGLAELLSLATEKFSSVSSKSRSKSPVPSYLSTKPPKPKKPAEEITEFKPKINPKSLLIVKNAEKEGRDLKKFEKTSPQPNPNELKPKKRTISIKEFLDRNYTLQLAKYEAKKDTMPVASLDKIDSKCTFRPFLCEKSRGMITHHKDLYELGVRHVEEKRNQAKEALEKKQNEEMKLCTFTPKINKTIAFGRGSSRTPEKRDSYSKQARNLTPFQRDFYDI